jgi:hypothetical protein
LNTVLLENNLLAGRVYALSLTATISESTQEYRSRTDDFSIEVLPDCSMEKLIQLGSDIPDVVLTAGDA